MGGHRFNELFGAQGPDEATMKSLAQTVLRERLGITDEPTDCLVSALAKLLYSQAQSRTRDLLGECLGKIRLAACSRE